MWWQGDRKKDKKKNVGYYKVSDWLGFETRGVTASTGNYVIISKSDEEDISDIHNLIVEWSLSRKKVLLVESEYTVRWSGVLIRCLYLVSCLKPVSWSGVLIRCFDPVIWSGILIWGLDPVFRFGVFDTVFRSGVFIRCLIRCFDLVFWSSVLTRCFDPVFRPSIRCFDPVFWFGA